MKDKNKKREDSGGERRVEDMTFWGNWGKEEA